MRRLFLAQLLACAAAPVLAQGTFPNKPIRLVLGSGPGGLADVTTRLVGQKLSERLGQPVVVENKPGAGGIVGAQSVLAAPPDGHTLFVMVGGNAIAKALLASLPFDLEKDFAPISSVAFFDLLLLVRKDSPLRTLDDLLKQARSRPEGLSLGTTSTGSIQSLTAFLFTSATGIRTNIIPFKTSADIGAAVMRGDVDVGIDAYASLRGPIDGGLLRAVVATGAHRSPMQPNVPTMRESGYPAFEVSSWNSFYTAAGAPPAAIALLNRHVVEILAQQDIRKRFAEIGAEARSSTPGEMGALMKQNIAKWTDTVEKAGIPKQ